MPQAAHTRRTWRREALRAALVRDPLLTDAALAELLGVSPQTVRLDRMALGIPEVRGRARAAAERLLRGEPSGSQRGEVLDLEPGVSALALLPPPPPGAVAPELPSHTALFADAEALALAVSGLTPASVRVANVKFQRPLNVQGRLVAKAQVLRQRPADDPQRRVVLVQIRADDQPLVRAKFVVGAVAAGS